MKLLIIIPYEGFSRHVSHYLDEMQEITTTTVIPPYYSCYSRTGKMLDKKQVVAVMVFNFFFFIYRFVIRKREKYEVILLNSHIVAIPFLFLARILPFINARKKIIVTFFFLHGLGKKRVVQKILRFLFRNRRVLLVAQSSDEVEYYSQLMDKDKIIYFPFCQHEVSISEDCGKGEEYLFSGGYTNRDYECLFEAARKVNHKFIIICSRLNQIDTKQAPNNVRILTDTPSKDFHGYLKNSKIVIIPLKDKTGSSGQKVALAAMLFKKPIIYTNIDSISQYFEDGVTGIPYEINNAADLSDKIQRLLSTPDLREKLGANAFKTYYERYHISKYCEFMADLILR